MDCWDKYLQGESRVCAAPSVPLPYSSLGCRVQTAGCVVLPATVLLLGVYYRMSAERTKPPATGFPWLTLPQLGAGISVGVVSSHISGSEWKQSPFNFQPEKQGASASLETLCRGAFPCLLQVRHKQPAAAPGKNLYGLVVTPEKARIWIRANKGKDKTSEINESGKN